MIEKAIEAAARAIWEAKKSGDLSVWVTKKTAKICIEAAIATGELVPASKLAELEASWRETLRKEREDLLHNTRLKDQFRQERDEARAVAAEMKERCAVVGQIAASNKCSDIDTVKLTGHIVGPAVAAAIRALEPTSGEYVLVPKELINDLTEHIDPIDDIHTD